MSQQELQSQRVALGRLLQTAGGSETPAWTDVEAVDYDWSVPHHFIPAQLERLSAFAAAAAGKIAEALNSLLRSDMQLAAGAIQEQYARDLRAGEDEAAEYFTPLMTGSGEPYGTLALPAGVAVGWVQQLLGGTAGQGGEGKEPSSLESSLLQDIFAALAASLSAASAEAGGATLRAGKEITKGLTVADDDGNQEYCRITFHQQDSDEQAAVSLLASSRQLELLAGAAASDQTPEQAQAATRTHLEEVLIVAEVQLGTATVTLSDALSLEPGDVLLIQKHIGEPIDLLVGGCSLFSGLPVTCSGQYGIQITPPAGPPGR